MQKSQSIIAWNFPVVAEERPGQAHTCLHHGDVYSAIKTGLYIPGPRMCQCIWGVTPGAAVFIRI